MRARQQHSPRAILCWGGSQSFGLEMRECRWITYSPVAAEKKCVGEIFCPTCRRCWPSKGRSMPHRCNMQDMDRPHRNSSECGCPAPLALLRQWEAHAYTALASWRMGTCNAMPSSANIGGVRGGCVCGHLSTHHHSPHQKWSPIPSICAHLLDCLAPSIERCSECQKDWTPPGRLIPAGRYQSPSFTGRRLALEAAWE